VALSYQVVQKSLDITLVQILGMMLVMEKDELPTPVNIATRCARTVMATEARQADLIEEFWFFAARCLRNTPLSCLHGKAPSYWAKLKAANRGLDLHILATRQGIKKSMKNSEFTYTINNTLSNYTDREGPYSHS